MRCDLAMLGICCLHDRLVYRHDRRKKHRALNIIQGDKTVLSTEDGNE